MNSFNFRIAAGSIVGADHLGRNDLIKGDNNHDAHRYMNITSSDGRTTEGILAVVADGCGGMPRKNQTRLGIRHSEVGAWIGLELLATTLTQQLSRLDLQEALSFESASILLERTRQDLLAQLRVLANAMTPQNQSFTQTVNDYFLFTVVGALLTPLTTAIFSLGDGFYALNGEIKQLGPFPENRPPYLAYGLINPVDYADNQEQLHFQVLELLPTSKVNSLLVGTDGVADLIAAAEKQIPGSEESVGPISQFWNEPRYLTNRYAIYQRLCLLNSEARKLVTSGDTPRIESASRLLRDDTTLVVITREPERKSCNE